MADLIPAMIEAIKAAAAEGGTPDAIAQKACQALQRAHGGARVYLPALSTGDRAREILAARRGGMRVDEIAQKLGVSVKTVARAITRANRLGIRPDQAEILASPGWFL